MLGIVPIINKVYILLKKSRNLIAHKYIQRKKKLGDSAKIENFNDRRKLKFDSRISKIFKLPEFSLYNRSI